MMVALNTTGYATNPFAGTPIPNLPSYLGCIILLTGQSSAELDADLQ